MKEKSKFLNIFIFSSIFISFAFSPVNLAAQDADAGKTSSEEKVDGDASKKPKGMPGKKKEYKTINEFLEDGEYVSMEGFMNILHETEKDKYYMVLNEDQLNTLARCQRPMLCKSVPLR